MLGTICVVISGIMFQTVLITKLLSNIWKRVWSWSYFPIWLSLYSLLYLNIATVIISCTGLVDLHDKALFTVSDYHHVW